MRQRYGEVFWRIATLGVLTLHIHGKTNAYKQLDKM